MATGGSFGGSAAAATQLRWEHVMDRNLRSRSLWAAALLVSVLATLGLSTAPATAAAAPVDATAASDWNGDGRADVVLPGTDGNLWFYRGDGAGGFAGSRTKIGSGWNTRDQARVVPDWDGLAGSDVIARDPRNGDLWFYSGNGSGGFRTWYRIGTGWQVFSQIFSPGDWDGDGNTDLLAIVRSTGDLRLYRGNGTGGFLGQRVIGTGWQRYDGLMTTGDFDGDGRPDFLARNTATGDLRLYRGNGSGGFGTTRTVGTGWQVFDGLLGVGDWSGDGHSDVLARLPDGRLKLYRGRGNGGWIYPMSVIDTKWYLLRFPGSASTTSATGLPPLGKVTYTDHVAQWNVLCSDDHKASDDPIVFPGQFGASHHHTFFGNRSTNAATTLASLLASTSSCGRDMGTSDRSAYWVPSLMKKNPDGTTSVVESQQLSQIYYRRPGGGRGPGVYPFPPGLRMIAGNAKATSDQPSSIVSWTCGRGGPESPHMFTCPGGSSAPMVVSLGFPSCWDGVHLDSADHKSHMAYAAGNGACPTSHPVPLPELNIEVEYVNLGGGPEYFLANGGIYGFHGDFFNAWDNRVQNALVARCLNGARECAGIHRSGDILFRPDYDPEPITIDLRNYSSTSPWNGWPLQEPTPSSMTTTMPDMGH